MEGLPRRGPDVRALGLALPPDHMPLRRGLRPLKRWRYVGAFATELMLCVGEARVGPLAQRFWAIAEPGRPLTTATRFGRRGVRLERARVRVDAPGAEIDLVIDEDGGVESIHPSGRDGYVWTRKQAGVAARGEVRVGGRRYALDCEAVVDETAGYHERHTHWRWAAGVGRGGAGERLGWNLVAGVNDSERASERTIWVDGEPFEPGRSSSSTTARGSPLREGGALHFEEWCAREERTNLLVVRSYYRQPFGVFRGVLPPGVQLVRGCGVTEVHDVYW